MTKSNVQIAVPSAQLLTPQHRRFNKLVRQLEAARSKMAAWQNNLGAFRQLHHQVLSPLHSELTDALRELVFALDKAAAAPGFSRRERDLLGETICETAGYVLEGTDDKELSALFDKHSDVDFETEKHTERLAMKEMAEFFTGIDLGDDNIESDEDLARRMHEKLSAQPEFDSPSRRARKPTKRQVAAQARHEAEQKLVTQSVRDIYRKLVSALHPDREPDAARREAKTTLMQKINRAYAANDLLTLLEAQLQIEQLDTGQLAALSGERLRHYIQVLEEQLMQLRVEINDHEMQFRLEFDLDPFRAIDCNKLGGLIDEMAKELRYELAGCRKEISMLRDTASTKLWLRRQRQTRREGEADFF